MPQVSEEHANAPDPYDKATCAGEFKLMLMDYRRLDIYPQARSSAEAAHGSNNRCTDPAVLAHEASEAA